MDDRFTPLPREESARDEIVRPSLTYWQDAWKRFRRNIPAMVAGSVLVLMVLACIVLPLVWPYTYAQTDRAARYALPSAQHWFGTDKFGRDLFIRVVYGGRISLSIGLVGSLINLTIGVLYGGFSGYLGGKLDMVLMRIVEILDAIPLLLYVILLQVVFKDTINAAFATVPFLRIFEGVGAQLFLVYIVLGSVYWVGMARMVRGQVMSLKNNEYVLAARSMGAGTWRLVLRHLIPNAIGQIIVMVTMAIPTAIFAESFLSFIGLGVSEPMASWGSLASDVYGEIVSHPTQLLFPALAICITVLAFNILGDGLRDALDPRMRK